MYTKSNSDKIERIKKDIIFYNKRCDILTNRFLLLATYFLIYIIVNFIVDLFFYNKTLCLIMSIIRLFNVLIVVIARILLNSYEKDLISSIKKYFYIIDFLGYKDKDISKIEEIMEYNGIEIKRSSQ